MDSQDGVSGQKVVIEGDDRNKSTRQKERENLKRRVARRLSRKKIGLIQREQNLQGTIRDAFR